MSYLRELKELDLIKEQIKESARQKQMQKVERLLGKIDLQ
jgi:hypothetical protein